MPENALVYILHGQAERLIEASAEAAASLAGQGKDGDDQGQILIFDCISRALFLGEAYADELQRVQTALGPDQALYGVATLGEIASSTGGPPRFLNKSTIVAGLP